VAPFQLRGVVPKNGVKVDTTIAPYRLNEQRGYETVVLISTQARLSPISVLQLRWGFDDNRSGAPGASRTGFVNPTIGALFAVPLKHGLRLATSVTMGLPLASGGGNGADPNNVLLQKQGLLARSAMDNTTFALNDVGFPVGVSLAYIGHGLTAQLDTTVIPSVRIKGAASQQDTSKVSSTCGLFFGYQLIAELSLGTELRYQRYLTTPAAVEKDSSTRDNLTVAAGARLHLCAMNLVVETIAPGGETRTGIS